MRLSFWRIFRTHFNKHICENETEYSCVKHARHAVPVRYPSISWMKLFQINIKSPLSLLQNFHQMTFMTYTASTEIIYAHTIISRRFTEMKRNTDYVHKILSWLVYQSYSDDGKWRIAACRHRMLCLLESPTNGSINTLFKNYPFFIWAIHFWTAYDVIGRKSDLRVELLENL